MRSTATAALAVATLALAACGGSGGDEPEGPTRAEFIAKTDARCKASNARTKALNDEVARAAAGTRSQAELLRNLAPILARGSGQLRDNAAVFRSAVPPAADTAEVEQIRKLYDEQAELVRKLAAAAKAGDLDAFKALSEEQKDLLARARKAASAYGFKECGSTKSDAG